MQGPLQTRFGGVHAHLDRGSAVGITGALRLVEVGKNALALAPAIIKLGARKAAASERNLNAH